MAEELIGKLVGGYEIIEIVGRGGMAVVYRAHQVSMNRKVALKVLPRHFLNDDTYLQRFHREVKIVSTLEHRSIVPVYDYGEYNGQPYIAMRYMAGGSLEDRLKNGAMSLEHILAILDQIAPALDFAHRKDILHRDLKPSNILLDDGGGAYITDFGIARILGETGGTITTQGVVGTPSYMSPEQAQAKPMDGRSDVYALGVMLFEMATGRRPFESDTPYSIAVMQVTEKPPQPRRYNPALSAAIEQVILTALRKNPHERYANAAELVAALRQAHEDPALFDTQPRVISQPETPPPAPVQVIIPPPVPYTPPAPPVYAPPPVQQYTPPPAPVSQPRVERLSRRRRPNLLLNWVVGSLIGCGLLTLVMIAGVVIVQNMSGQGEQIAQTRLAADVPAENTAPVLDDASPVIRLGTNTPPPTIARPTQIPQPGVVYITATYAQTPPTEALPVGVRPPPTWTPILVPITVTPGGSSAVASADNPTSTGLDGQVIFFAERDANFDLYSLDLATLSQTRLTDVAQADSYPLVSPDGSRIVFQSSRDGDFDIYVADINGGNTQRVVDNDVTDRLPGWSPDGEWIVFSSDTRGDGTFDLFIVRPDGTDLRQIVSNDARNSHPRWSPDGRYIAFTTGDPDDARTWEIARYEVETEQIAYLTLNTLKDWSPVFSPDGQTILYLTDGDGFSAVAQMDIAGENARVIFDGAGYEIGASYSPDGTSILFTSNVTGDDELYVMDADGSNVRQLTTEGGLYGHWFTD
jgi:serine/threonine-protein kinase